ncbi:hypothetical protein MAUB_34110 [Mycolicibacterium aubagnense]|uniref:Mycothiol-dependent maleylpyruvate isomerase metal-binding domain-containing protein n=1 Tax=Mycolicibacterium aubagnense TaxID=319707 RepID=A0ABM7IFS2_9MYCO|nr:hypothetical protein MAUB_34110 [Mycolicibacterium aubagnense]
MLVLETAYRDARQRIGALARELSAEQLRTPVPATPDWTVHDVLAHLVGGAADVATGRLDGAGTDQWTRRHLQERRHRPIDDLMAEWDRAGPAVEATLTSAKLTGPNLAADAICHESDLREALSLGRVEREHWQPFLETMMRLTRLRARHSPALLIEDDRGQQWHCGSGEPTRVVRVDGYELLRAAYSRRSRRQIAAWNWAPTPDTQVIEGFGFFGPRDDDQPIPLPRADNAG